MRLPLLLAALLALLLGACEGASGRDQIRIVGSSTVYPFTTAVAEQFKRRYPEFGTPIVESTGTGGGIKLFCEGVGARQPDVVNASRRIKLSEIEDCYGNGVRQIVEVQVGLDGIVVANARQGPEIELTTADIYEALAARPWGRPQTARLWSDVNSDLPPIPIEVLGPPPTSGTRDAFNELIMQAGCLTNPAMEELEERDEDAFQEICTHIREDGAYVEAGENDNLIVQKLVANPRALGVFGFSFAAENADRVKTLPLDGARPTYASILSGDYTAARPLYIYVKGEHVGRVPGLAEFVQEYARDSTAGPQGFLARRGLIAAPAETRARNVEVARTMTPLDPAAIEG